MSDQPEVFTVRTAEDMRRVREALTGVSETDKPEVIADCGPCLDLRNRVERIEVTIFGDPDAEVIGLVERIEAVERRVTELDGWHPGYPDEMPLADRVAALEREIRVARVEALRDALDAARLCREQGFGSEAVEDEIVRLLDGPGKLDD